MAAKRKSKREGGCSCRTVRYALSDIAPMIVHCCHCRWCQRETGSAFVLNALFEAEHVTPLASEPELILTPSESGRGQRIARCPTCKVALWSNYPQAGDKVRFVRVGTLDEPDAFPPTVHIYTSSKQPWVILPEGVPAFAEFYNPREVWSAETGARWKALKGG
jgi:hypothetical protein